MFHRHLPSYFEFLLYRMVMISWMIIEVFRKVTWKKNCQSAANLRSFSISHGCHKIFAASLPVPRPARGNFRITDGVSSAFERCFTSMSRTYHLLRLFSCFFPIFSTFSAPSDVRSSSLFHARTRIGTKYLVARITLFSVITFICYTVLTRRKKLYDLRSVTFSKLKKQVFSFQKKFFSVSDRFGVNFFLFVEYAQ